MTVCKSIPWIIVYHTIKLFSTTLKKLFPVCNTTNEKRERDFKEEKMRINIDCGGTLTFLVQFKVKDAKVFAYAPQTRPWRLESFLSGYLELGTMHLRHFLGTF